MFNMGRPQVVETNDAVTENPELLNTDPLEKGFLIRLKMTDPSEMESLMDDKEYAAFCESEE